MINALRFLKFVPLCRLLATHHFPFNTLFLGITVIWSSWMSRRMEATHLTVSYRVKALEPGMMPFSYSPSVAPMPVRRAGMGEGGKCWRRGASGTYCRTCINTSRPEQPKILAVFIYHALLARVFLNLPKRAYIYAPNSPPVVIQAQRSCPLGLLVCVIAFRDSDKTWSLLSLSARLVHNSDIRRMWYYCNLVLSHGGAGLDVHSMIVTQTTGNSSLTK